MTSGFQDPVMICNKLQIFQSNETSSITCLENKKVH